MGEVACKEREGMAICPVESCEYNRPDFEDGVDWHTSCLQGEDHYLNCGLRADRLEDPYPIVDNGGAWGGSPNGWE